VSSQENFTTQTQKKQLQKTSNQSKNETNQEPAQASLPSLFLFSILSFQFLFFSTVCQSICDFHNVHSFLTLIFFTHLQNIQTTLIGFRATSPGIHLESQLFEFRHQFPAVGTWCIFAFRTKVGTFQKLQKNSKDLPLSTKKLGCFFMRISWLFWFFA